MTIPKTISPQLPTVNRHTHIGSLDGVRGIAVILVLAVHFQNMGVLPLNWAMARLAATAMSWGWSGVDLFFVLSGFLITGILFDKKTAKEPLQSFYVRRSSRIFPLYYAVLLLCGAASILLRHSPSGQRLWPSPIGWLFYLFYLQNWWMPLAELHHMAFLGPFWSLAIEEQFYLIWPAFVWHLPKTKVAISCWIGIVVAVLLRWWLMEHASTAFSYVVYMNTFTRMDGLLIGSFCAIVVRDAILLRRVRKIIPFAAIAAVMGLARICSNPHQIWNDHDTMVYGHLLLEIGFGCLILSAYLSNYSGSLFDRCMRSSGLVSFGKYSYGIYVYQGFILEVILHLFSRRPWWGHSLLCAFVVGLGWIGLPFLIAFLSYHLFEKKFLRSTLSYILKLESAVDNHRDRLPIDLNVVSRIVAVEGQEANSRIHP
jgi:peptidoglycan/LPS O-acetylase OafA/YrhL